MHPLHGNPYSLTLISIDGHLHSPLIRLVDVRLSSPFLSSQPPPYTTIVEDIATEYKLARRAQFTLDYVEAHEDPEDGASLKEA